MASYEVPSWAGKPPPGLHLDTFKDDKFVQKIMIDEKKVIRLLFSQKLQSKIEFSILVLSFWSQSGVE